MCVVAPLTPLICLVCEGRSSLQLCVIASLVLYSPGLLPINFILGANTFSCYQTSEKTRHEEKDGKQLGRKNVH